MFLSYELWVRSDELGAVGLRKRVDGLECQSCAKWGHIHQSCCIIQPYDTLYLFEVCTSPLFEPWRQHVVNCGGKLPIYPRLVL